MRQWDILQNTEYFPVKVDGRDLIMQQFHKHDVFICELIQKKMQCSQESLSKSHKGVTLCNF